MLHGLKNIFSRLTCATGSCRHAILACHRRLIVSFIASFVQEYNIPATIVYAQYSSACHRPTDSTAVLAVIQTYSERRANHNNNSHRFPFVPICSQHFPERVPKPYKKNEPIAVPGGSEK